MKYCMFFILIFISAWQAVFAQPARTIRVNAGEDVAQAYSPYGFYRFPQFGKATLYFTTGGRNTGLLFNYNIFSGAIQFINPKGDTLDLVNSPGLDSIAFEKTMFIFNDGFLEVVAQADSIRLLKKLILKSQAENIGAYGQPNPNSAITNVQKFTAGGAVYNLVINRDIVLTEDIDWFFLHGKTGAVKANKTNLLKLLPVDKQAKAESYLNNNKISFNKETDLKNLLAAIRS